MRTDNMPAERRAALARQVLEDLRTTPYAEMQEQLRTAGWIQITTCMWRSPAGELRLTYPAWKTIPRA